MPSTSPARKQSSNPSSPPIVIGIRYQDGGRRMVTTTPGPIATPTIQITRPAIDVVFVPGARHVCRGHRSTLNTNFSREKLKKSAGEAYRQASSSPARHLSRRSDCAHTGDDVLIVPQTTIAKEF